MAEKSKRTVVRVVYSTRVLPQYRVPLMEALAKDPAIELLVVTNRNRKGSKAVNFCGSVPFNITELSAYRPALKTTNGIAELSIPIGLGKTLLKFSPDVVITEGASHVFGNLIAFSYAKIFRRGIAQWSLGKILDRQPSFARRLVDFIFFRAIERNSDAIIAYSKTGADYFFNIGVERCRVVVALNTTDTEKRMVDQEEYAEENGLLYPSPVPKKFNVAYLGALTEVKRVDLLIEAFGLLKEVVPTAHLSVGGEGPLREVLDAKVSALGLKDDVTFWGHVSDTLPRFFYDASVLVMPGLGGLVISDALAHGVPVICGVGDGSEKDIITDECGKILQTMDAETLSNELVKISHDTLQQKRWRLGALQTAKKKLSVQNYKQSLLQAITIAKRN